MSMRVEPARAEDVPALAELLSVLFAQEAEFVPDRSRQESGLKQIISNPSVGSVLVLRDASAVYGMVNLLFTVSTALGCRVAILEDMVVRPDRRGSGAGSMLLESAIEYARRAGCGRITLLTDASNTSAQRFYGRAGFVLSPMVPMRLSLGQTATG